MPEELTIDVPIEPKKRPFWLTWRGLAIAGCAFLVILAAIFSWWLANGTVFSVAARMDTMIYSVEPEFSTQIRNIYVQPGDNVQAGQPLGSIDASPASARMQDMAQELVALRNAQGFDKRLSAAQIAEKRLAAKATQARYEEERLKKVYQDLVTEHVRAQLAMRSIDRRNHGAWQQASSAENIARARMEAANAEFEQASHLRASIDMELNKLRAQLSKARANPNRNLPELANIAPNESLTPGELYAPVAGRIMRINAAPGQMLQKGQPVFIILPTGEDYASQSWVEAWFPLDAQKSLETGQKALVRFENGLHLDGKVEAIGSAITPETSLSGHRNMNSVINHEKEQARERFLPVKIVLDDPAAAGDIPPGSKADCQIQTRYLLGYTFFN